MNALTAPQSVREAVGHARLLVTITEQINIRVVTLLPPEEQSFPADGFEQIAGAILRTGQAHVIGQDVRIQRFFCSIYETPGIAEVDLSFAYSTDPDYVPVPADCR